MAHLVGRRLRHRLIYKERRKDWNNKGARQDIIAYVSQTITLLRERARAGGRVCVLYELS